MNKVEQFLRRLLPAKKIPPAPRGRVDVSNPDVIGPGAVKAKATPVPHVRYRVYRAATNIWEPTVEAAAMLVENPELPIKTPDGSIPDRSSNGEIK